MKLVKAFGAAAVLAASATAAYGGYVQPYPVEVDLTNMIASGDTVTARYADNKTEMIGCGARRYQGGTAWAFCQARTAKGEQILCTTFDQYLVDTVASSADFGFITFSWNKSDECTRIGFSNQSFYLPQNLDSN
ncbi:MAG: hypothetical protein R3C40_03715 [Parvularculaceae bacterium]|nr:hypothetical protein [Parvularculaceae bacterium]